MSIFRFAKNISNYIYLRLLALDFDVLAPFCVSFGHFDVSSVSKLKLKAISFINLHFYLKVYVSYELVMICFTYLITLARVLLRQLQLQRLLTI